MARLTVLQTLRILSLPPQGGITDMRLLTWPGFVHGCKLRVLTRMQQTCHQPSGLPGFAFFFYPFPWFGVGSIPLLVDVNPDLLVTSIKMWPRVEARKAFFKLLEGHCQALPHTRSPCVLCCVLFSAPCGPLIGVCIFNCQIASIPSKWVEFTLPFRVNEKRSGPGRSRTTDNVPPRNREGPPV